MAEKYLPQVLFMGINCNPEELVVRILGENSIINKKNDEYSIYYLWHIENKYYNAKVKLAIINPSNPLNETLLETVHGIVIYIDDGNIANTEALNRIVSLLDESDIEIKLLVSGVNLITQLNKIDLSKWCINKGFELINLSEEHSEDNDLHEKYGVERIVEALQTHIWPNAEVLSNIDISKNNTSLETDMEKEHDDFCELFSTLSAMKESVNSLPRDQRLQCAKQIVTAFWSAIGGSDDELDEEIVTGNVK